MCEFPYFLDYIFCNYHLDMSIPVSVINVNTVYIVKLL